MMASNLEKLNADIVSAASAVEKRFRRLIGDRARQFTLTLDVQRPGGPRVYRLEFTKAGEPGVYASIYLGDIYRADLSLSAIYSALKAVEDILHDVPAN